MVRKTGSEQFPKGFLWGGSTSSHQVEGGTHNQWTVWELEQAAHRARTARKRLGWVPVWEEIKQEASSPSNYVSGRGVDHFRRYEEDFDVLKSLNLNAFRFGIEWSRLEPEQGHWDEAAWQHYKDYIKALKRRGIEPVLNIWHWTLPVWFAEKGGFEKRGNLVHFDRFVKKVADELLDDVRYVLTINEANNYSLFGYLLEEWPPGRRNPWQMLLVNLNLVSAHKRAYRIIKRHRPKVMVGAAHNAVVSLPMRSKHPVDILAAKASGYFWQNWFFSRIRECQDFVAFNYYFTNYYRYFKIQNPRHPLNDLGWYMEPSKLYELIIDMHKRYKKPIIIAENGVADLADKHRQWWLQETMSAIQRSRAEGADVVGYFHWSLLDNFEWAEGWWPKFGLVEVDHAHGLRRKIRQSAKWWAEYIAHHSSKQ